MEFEALAASFATIIGLLCNFRQERGATEALDHQQFMEWLEYHRHEELKDLIARTHHLGHELDVLLQEDQQEILQRLRSVDSVLALILSKLEGFTKLTSIFAPKSPLSRQAIGILRLYANSDADGLMILDTGFGAHLLLCPGDGIKCDEPRFLLDDLSSLLSFGLLQQDYTKNGDIMYRLTRAGSEYASLLGSDPDSDNS